jgi:ribose transport system substrate-binding protein
MRNRMHGRRTLTATLLAFCLAVGLTACGSGSNGGSGKHYKLGFIPGVRGDKYYVSLQCGAQAEARKLGVTLEAQGGTAFDPASQIPVLQAVSATNPDAIVIAPVDSKAMFTPLQVVHQQGAKLVLVDTTLDDTSIVESAIHSNYFQGGVQGARILSQLMGGKGTALLISIKPGISTLDEGKGGFEQEIAKHAGITYLGAEYGNNDQVKVASIVAATLSAHPDLKGIFLPSGTDAEGVGAALKRAGKTGEVKVVAYDAYPAEVEQLRRNEVQALIVQKPYEMGQLGVRMAVDALNGKQTTKQILTDLLVATKDNVDSPAIKPFLYHDC